MSDFQTIISRQSDALPVFAWDMMCGDNQPFSHVKWLRLLEVITTHYDPYYAQIWQGDTLVAGVVCHPQRHFHLSAHLSSPLLAWGATQFLKAATPLSCMLPLYAYPGIIFAENAPVTQVLPVLSDLLKQIQQQSRSHFLSINPVSTQKHVELVNWRGFSATQIVDDAVLDIVWDDYGAYQMWLPGKKRAEIRRVRNRAADAGVYVDCLPLAKTDGTRIEQLMQMVMTHHGSSYMFESQIIEKTAVILNENDYRHMVAIHQGDIIGTLTLFHSAGVVLVRWVGLEYERTKKTYAYPLLMSETVRIAIDMGAKQLKLGGTVFTLKKQLGATLENRVALLKLRNPLLNSAMGRVLGWQQSHR
ncbi:MAG: hypothetical protein GY943_39125 [Chloroflexi bacterium]|nr:hypothetical protein [Chloroflexota bacterium]